MSKNTAPQTQVQTPAELKKEKRKTLFGLSKDELSMVVGGTGVVVTKPKP
jgi:hypothetical protein